MGWSNPPQYMILATLCLVALLAACSPADPGADTAPDPISRIAAGADLFAEQCGDCHGDSGRGPALATLQALSPEDLRAGIKNHPTAGTIPERLPASELSDLVEYLEQ